ncbi:ABC transporter ATP-binding protein [Corynebacterium pelargi]|uniref:Iron import ATP-binding/permease protein IrtB n=1 Tax=Corynebacterium pelargi TaxID=1471400 RepID=A0A410W6U6_9CORY|nr:ABC transporter ATP-binding protein [Corynebacterium pelargi]QAU51761.1 Iron import ATP-binding/permease protein IrtB [Corynebacterium pelargi]GGG72655.1 ABC transporter [Corynebacterium pelargi]
MIATQHFSPSFLRRVAQLLSVEGKQHLRRMFVLSLICGVIRGLALVAFLPGAASLVSGDPVWGLRFSQWLLVLALVACISAVLEYFLAIANYSVAIDVVASIHLKIGQRVSRLPLGYFKPQSAGEFSRLVSRQMLILGESFAHMYSPMIMHACTMLVLLIGTWVWAPTMGLILSATVPVVVLAAYLANRCERRSSALTDPPNREVASRLVEFAQNQAILRACGKAQAFQPLEAAINTSERRSSKALWWGLLGQLINGTAAQNVAVLAMVLAVGVGTGLQDPVATIVFIGIMLRFTTILNEIGQLGMGVQASQPLLEQVFELLDEPIIEDPERTRRITEPGAIAMRNVSFSYTKDCPVLRDVSFAFPPHSFNAIVGPSGSGKTTIARLIARFYPVDHGEVLVGGVRVEEQALAQLMSQLAWVFQDVYLYDDTLRANILVGNPHASEEQLRHAARLAGVEEIIQRLPQGWDTPVGEGGRALSGGERQRVSIARAILKDAPIVLFDEATSALDPANEQRVVQALEYLRQRSTLVVIAHKLSTIESADNIVVLNDQGRISQQGTHEELLHQDGTYQQFWQRRHAAQGWSLT